MEALVWILAIGWCLFLIGLTVWVIYESVVGPKDHRRNK